MRRRQRRRAGRGRRCRRRGHGTALRQRPEALARRGQHRVGKTSSPRRIQHHAVTNQLASAPTIDHQGPLPHQDPLPYHNPLPPTPAALPLTCSGAMASAATDGSGSAAALRSTSSRVLHPLPREAEWGAHEPTALRTASRRTFMSGGGGSAGRRIDPGRRRPSPLYVCVGEKCG